LAAQRRDLVYVAVPCEQSLIEAAHVLNKGLFKMQSGAVNQTGDGTPELGDNDLLRFVYGIHGGGQHDDPRDQQDADDASGYSLFYTSAHWFTSCTAVGFGVALFMA